MGLSQSYGPADKEESFAVLDRLLELKAAFIDTADVYGTDGHNEKLIGEWLKRAGPKARENVFLCTKFGFKSLDPIVICGSKEYVKQACEASLKRLQVDTIDLYYQHRVDPSTPIEETVSAMAELVSEGKVRYLGLSECSAETIRRAHKIHPIAAVQVEYSPWTTDIEHNGILSTCQELGITIVAFSPLGRGFLTGQYKSVDDFDATDARRNMPRFQGDAFAQNLKLVEALQAIASRKGVTVAQLTLAWVVAQAPNVIPIPGTKKDARLVENLGARQVALTPTENEDVRKVLDAIPAVGERYAPKFLALSNI
ncbi:putative oxidoreductase [Obelidium mucronatum]|nr:putative oxidoreductase [Obelidium mucronatum]